MTRKKQKAKVKEKAAQGSKFTKFKSDGVGL